MSETMSRPMDHEQRLAAALDKMEKARALLTEAAADLAPVPAGFIGRGAQEALLAWCTDAMAAADHVQIDLQRMSAIEGTASGIAKSAKEAAEGMGRLEWAVRQHYADLLSSQGRLPLGDEEPADKPAPKKRGRPRRAK